MFGFVKAFWFLNGGDLSDLIFFTSYLHLLFFLNFNLVFFFEIYGCVCQISFFFFFLMGFFTILGLRLLIYLQ
ncbi:hypothetical protein BSU00_00875 [Tenacibaculum sp. SG-28]|nr:hypothetical protein BSU00_00875 [Tenacibaculum sp. SG-28]